MKPTKLFLFFLMLLILSSCGGGLKMPKSGDARNIPSEGRERAKKNIEEGRGISLKNLGNRKTTYEFSTANPMWRATFDVIDFMPLTTVDYSGGMIVSDWYTGDSANESIKISIRFLSNEIRSDSLKIIIHKKNCANNLSCQTKLLSNSKISQELRSTILTKAAQLEKESKNKKKN